MPKRGVVAAGLPDPGGEEVRRCSSASAGIGLRRAGRRRPARRSRRPGAAGPAARPGEDPVAECRAGRVGRRVDAGAAPASSRPSDGVVAVLRAHGRSMAWSGCRSCGLDRSVQAGRGRVGRPARPRPTSRRRRQPGRADRSAAIAATAAATLRLDRPRAAARSRASVELGLTVACWRCSSGSDLTSAALSASQALGADDLVGDQDDRVGARLLGGVVELQRQVVARCRPTLAAATALPADSRSARPAPPPLSICATPRLLSRGEAPLDVGDASPSVRLDAPRRHRRTSPCPRRRCRSTPCRRRRSRRRRRRPSGTW